MIKIKVEVYWELHPDIERTKYFYVDEYNEETRKIIFDWIRSYFVDDIPDYEVLEKYYGLKIDVEGAVFLCDLCERETDKINTISLMVEPNDYDLCQTCYQKVVDHLEETKKENLKWRTDILGDK